MRWIIAITVAIAVITALIVFAAMAAPGSRDSTSSSAPTSTPDPSGTPSASESPSPDVPPSPGLPSEGSISPDGRAVAAPVPITSDAVVAPGISASVSLIEAVEGEARAPGDVAGPSLRVTIVIANGTPELIDLSTARTNVYYGADATPAAELPGPGTSALPVSVGAGQSVSTTLVFSVPTGDRDDVSIEFDYSVDVPIVAFQGATPR